MDKDLPAAARLVRLPTLFSKPVEGMEATFTLNDGILNLQALEVQSSAFQAQTKGDIQLQADWMQTPVDLPVVFKLERSIAEKSNLLPKNVPDTEDYVTLPPFLHLSGPSPSYISIRMHGDWEGSLCAQLSDCQEGLSRKRSRSSRRWGTRPRKSSKAWAAVNSFIPFWIHSYPNRAKIKMATVLMIKARVLYHKKVSTYSRGSFVSHSKPRTPIMKKQTPEADHKKDE